MEIFSTIKTNNKFFIFHQFNMMGELHIVQMVQMKLVLEMLEGLRTEEEVITPEEVLEVVMHQVAAVEVPVIEVVMEPEEVEKSVEEAVKDEEAEVEEIAVIEEPD